MRCWRFYTVFERGVRGQGEEGDRLWPLGAHCAGSSQGRNPWLGPARYSESNRQARNKAMVMASRRPLPDSASIAIPITSGLSGAIAF
jgi:hypothetical protein